EEPALAVSPRAAGEGRREREIERGNLPFLLRATELQRDAERLQQVLRRIVVAVDVLDAFEDRELAARPHVHFELPHAIDDVVVDALGVLTVVFAAGLPVAFE